jgi:hypothetical protein
VENSTKTLRDTKHLENTMLKKISVILGIVVALLTAGGAWFTLDNRWAKAEDMKNIDTKLNKISKRLDQKILEDNFSNIQARIWSLEDRYRDKEMPQAVKEELRQLLEKKRVAIIKIDAIIKSVQAKKD